VELKVKGKEMKRTGERRKRRNNWTKEENRRKGGEIKKKNIKEKNEKINGWKGRTEGKYLSLVKGKFVSMLNQLPCNEDVWESGGIAPRILNLGTIWRWSGMVQWCSAGLRVG
jgi:hypothetical protein